MYNEMFNKWKNYLTEHKDDVDAGAGILLVSKDRDILLSKRSEIVPEPGTIGTIGGHLTLGEDPIVGAQREFYEEAGFDGPFDGIQLLTIQKKGNFSYYTFIASTDNINQPFEPDEEFAKEVIWNRWLKLDDVIGSTELHPELHKLFQDDSILDKIDSFITNIQ